MLLRKRDVTHGTDPVLRLMKSLYHSVGTKEEITLEELQKHRSFVESRAHLVYTRARLKTEKLYIDNVPAQWIMPHYKRPENKVILYCHGGGYICGGLEYAGILGRKLAARTGLDVLSFAYRLAPENRYPAALEDAVKAWEYLSGAGYAANQIIVAGDSAGGNLALELCLYLKKHGKSQPGAMVLFSPWTDMTATASTYEEEGEIDPIVTRIYAQNARNAYLGKNERDYRNPDFSPLFAELDGLPPTLIQVGKNEVLRHDSEALAAKMKKSEVDVKIQVYTHGWHVFQIAPSELAKTAMTEVYEFFRQKVYEIYEKPVNEQEN